MEKQKKKLSKKLEHLLTKILKTKALNIIFIYKGIKKVLSPHKKKKKKKKEKKKIKKKRGIKKVNLFHNNWNPLKLTQVCIQPANMTKLTQLNPNSTSRIGFCELVNWVGLEFNFEPHNFGLIYIYIFLNLFEPTHHIYKFVLLNFFSLIYFVFQKLILRNLEICNIIIQTYYMNCNDFLKK